MILPAAFRRLGWLLAAALLAITCMALQPTNARAQDDATLWLPLVRQDGASATLESPDASLRLRVYLTDARSASGAIRFDITRISGGVETPVVTTGRLGLDMKGASLVSSEDPSAYTALLASGTTYRWLGSAGRSASGHYAMPIAERGDIPDNYSESTIELQSLATAIRMQIVARVYNEGIALRYGLPEQEGWQSARIDGEFTLFAFASDDKVWAQSSTGSSHENEHLPATLSSAPTPMENPVTLQHSDGSYMALTEAAVENYPSSRFVRSGARGLQVDLRGPATGTFPFATPWRVLMVAPTAAKLVEQNYLMYNLAPSSRIADTSWLKPGKAMRVMNVTSADFAISVIDFAAARGIGYIEFDAGWYGPENNPAYSPLDPLMGADEFERVRSRAAQKGVGIVLYVNFVQLQRDVDNIMGLYRSWGVDGLKLGFVDGLTQPGIKEVLYTVQKAAQYHIFVDIHDNYCPSGMGRTWPNLFTQECVRGNEYYPGAEHNTTLPFTRMLLGPADYTIAWYSNLKNVTRAHQMALSVIYFSPLKFLFWYDTPSSYQGESEVDFFKNLPSTWDETQVLQADVANTVSIARRKDDAWFVGSITDSTARTVDIALDFLAPGVDYIAYLYADGGGTTVTAAQQAVTSVDTITVDLPANGGNAILLEPAAP